MKKASLRLITILLFSFIAAYAEQDVRFSGYLDPQPRPQGKRFSKSPRVTIVVFAPKYEEPYLTDAQEGPDYRFTTQIDKEIVRKQLVIEIKVEEVDRYVQVGYKSRVNVDNQANFRVPYPSREVLASFYFGLGNDSLAKTEPTAADLQQAAQLYSKAIKWNPSDARPYFALAQAWRRQGRYEEETSVYEEMSRNVNLPMHPSSLQYRLHNDWADAEFRKGTKEGWQKALTQYKSACELPDLIQSERTLCIQGWFDSILASTEYKEDRTFAAKVVSSEQLSSSWTDFYAAFAGKPREELPKPTETVVLDQTSTVKQALGRLQ